MVTWPSSWDSGVCVEDSDASDVGSQLWRRIPLPAYSVTARYCPRVAQDLYGAGAYERSVVERGVPETLKGHGVLIAKQFYF